MTPPLNLPAPGRRQSLYRVLTTSQRPVFLVNSRLGLFCATPSDSGDHPPHPTGVPLFPKLRGQFAEFLNEGSLTRLRSSSASTCVGFGYGHPQCSLEGFSRWERGNHFWPNGPGSALGVTSVRDLPRTPPSDVPPVLPLTGRSPSTRPPHRSNTLPVVPDYSPVCHRLRLSASA